MARFGTDASAPFDDLNGLISELLLAARRKARLAMVPDGSLQAESVPKSQQEWRENERVYYSGEVDDPIARRMVKIISDIEGTCRSIIEDHDR